MRTPGFAAIILNLVVRLVSCLRSQKIRAGTKHVGPRSKAVCVSADGQLDTGHRIKDAGAGHRVGNLIAEVGVAETDAMGKASGREVQSDRMYGSVSYVGERLK